MGEDNNTFTLRNGAQYTGETQVNEDKSLKIEGLGKMEWKDGVIYQGEWKENKQHGKGNTQWPVEAGKDEYDGPYDEGVRTGENGVFKWANGDHYKGDWSNN